MVADMRYAGNSVGRDRPAVNTIHSLGEPPAVPSGWEVRPPDFVGVGTMKSGTTWWWSMLITHPDIASPREFPADGGQSGEIDPHNEPYRAKEVHFFDHYGRVEQIDPVSYHRYFPRPAGSIAGEWTPRYMYDFWTPPMLRAVAPAARLLVMLRDPVDRFVSGVGHHQKVNGALTSPVMQHHYHRGLYWQQLRNLLGHFPREQVLVLQYEQCAREPETQIIRTFEFLGVDPARWHPPSGYTQRVGLDCPTPVIDQPTLRAVWQATEPDTARLLEDFPEIDRALWPSCAQNFPLLTHCNIQ